MSAIARLACAAVIVAACLPRLDVVDSRGPDDGGGVDAALSSAGSGDTTSTAGSSGASGAAGDGVGSSGTSGDAGGSATTGAAGTIAGSAGSSGGAGGASGGAGGSVSTGSAGNGGSNAGAAGNGQGGRGGGGSGGTGGAGGRGGTAGGGGAGGVGGAGGGGAGGTTCGRGAAVGTWADWPMPNAVAGILPNPQSYDTTTAGIVRDNVTGLVWQRVVDVNRYTYSSAMTYCASLTIGGCGGWRVPTRIELLSIVDYSRAVPAIDPNAFPNTPAESFWSATPSPKPAAAEEARYIDFTSGSVVSFDRLGQARVRCVR